MKLKREVQSSLFYMLLKMTKFWFLSISVVFLLNVHISSTQELETRAMMRSLFDAFLGQGIRNVTSVGIQVVTNNNKRMMCKKDRRALNLPISDQSCKLVSGLGNSQDPEVQERILRLESAKAELEQQNVNLLEEIKTLKKQLDESKQVATDYEHKLKNSGDWESLNLHVVNEFFSSFKEKELDDIEENVNQLYIEASLHRELQEFPESLSKYQKVMNVRRVLYGDEHKDTLKATYWTTWVLDDLERYNEALTLLLPLLERERRIFGNDTIETLATMNLIATAFTKIDNFAESIKYNDEIVERNIHLYGSDNNNTLDSIFYRGEILRGLKRYEESLKDYKSVIEVRERLSQNNYIQTLDAMYHSARILDKLNRYSEALPLLQDLLTRQRQVFGEDHRNTIDTMSELAVALGKIKRYSEALTMFENVLEKQRRVLGNDHVDTLNTISNVGAALANLKRFPESLKYFEEASERRTRVLGANNPNTLKSVRDKNNVQMMVRLAMLK